MRYVLVIILIIILIVFIFTSRSIFNLKSFLVPSFLNFSTSNLTFKSSDIFAPPKGYFGEYSGYSGTNSTSNLPAGFKEKDLSPYFKKIQIQSVKIYNTLIPYEEIIIYGNNINDKVNLNGWSVKSNKNYFVLVNAVSKLDFSKVFKPENILLEKGGKVQIYSTYSPLGIDFKSNKCIGYLNESYNFIPKLPTNCPQIEKRKIAYLSGACQDYILKLKSCEIPKNPPVSDVDCLNFIKKINYQGCYDTYKNDSDFFSKDYYIFMGRKILDDLHDRVLLFDNKGLLVDEYIY
jgi:hypothetical protein